jgi:hypothetical protein
VTTPLARITGAIDVPRGPDVLHRVNVARDWLLGGGTLSVRLPRNLTCATCAGGGCDACDRSGAITLRERRDPPEFVKVTLAGQTGDGAGERALTMRIPERGGRAADGELPRGVLMLTLTPADSSDPSLTRDSDLELARSSSDAPPSQPAALTRPRSSVVLWLFMLLLAALALGLAWTILRRG